MSYARWATKDEVAKRLDAIEIGKEIEKSGIPMAYDDNHLYIDSHEAHNMIIGSTGSGKTQVAILPLIKLSMLAKESMVINDPMGELYRNNADLLRKNGYKTIVVDFDDSRYGNSWNPLKMPYDLYKNGEKDKAIKYVEDIAYYMFYDPKEKNNDPFWINSTINFFTGIVLYLFEKANEDEINIASTYHFANYLITDGSKNTIKKIDKQGLIYMNLVGIIEAPTETKGSILSVFNQKMKKYVSREILTNMLSNTDFDLYDINKKPTALFIISGQSSFGNNFIPLLINQIIDCVKDTDTENRHLNILLDEFDSMVPIRNFARLVEYCRALRVKFTVTIRSFIHLNNMYTKEDAEILKLCFGNIIYLLSDDIYTLEEISKKCGYKEGGTPLISVEDLKTLDMFESIILMPRTMPFKTTLIPDYKINYNFSSEVCELPNRKNNIYKIYKEQ